VLNFTIFTSNCPHCLGTSGVPQEFRYLDIANGQRYVIYFFPVQAAPQLEDMIASTICLREHGTRIHFVHKISELILILRAYEAGNLPAENSFPVSEEAMIRAKSLNAQVEASAGSFFATIREIAKTGVAPPEFAENIKRGMEIKRQMEARANPPKKRSFLQRLFGS
jgi:hypothetical protein